MSRIATILGGHMDGETVPWAGPILRLPIPEPLAIYLHDEPPEPGGFKVAYFRAQQDDDGRWWYVREGRE